MSENNAPAPPTGYGRAAEKLADTVRHVVDLVAGPGRLKAIAQARGDAANIEAQSRVEVQEIETRAVNRLRMRETRRQKNIESITMKAIEALPAPDQVSNEAVSEDWATRFFEECQDIGDEDMQKIWAKILAGEVARPKSFSPKTLSVVRDLTRSDAKLFEHLSGAVWHVPGAGLVPIVHDTKSDTLKNAGITFAGLTHLMSIGLIEYQSSGYVIDGLTEIAPQYCGKIHSLRSDAPRRFPLGHVVLTEAGRQLLSVCDAAGLEEHRVAAIKQWEAAGWTSLVDLSAA